jgi:REP element-mobilizing transposase RayT
MRRSLGSLVAGLKSAVTSRVRDLFRDPAFEVWQDGYWDRGIRDEADLERTREYIRNNPAEWEQDPENGRRP